MNPKYNQFPDVLKKFDYLKQYLSISNEIRQVERSLSLNTKKQRDIASDQSSNKHEISKNSPDTLTNNGILSNAIINQLDDLKSEIQNIQKGKNYNLTNISPNPKRFANNKTTSSRKVFDKDSFGKMDICKNSDFKNVNYLRNELQDQKENLVPNIPIFCNRKLSNELYKQNLYGHQQIGNSNGKPVKLSEQKQTKKVKNQPKPVGYDNRQQYPQGFNNESINSKKETIAEISRRKIFNRDCCELKRKRELTSKSRTLSKNSRSQTISRGANGRRSAKNLKSISQSRVRNSITPSKSKFKSMLGSVFGTSQERNITGTSHTFNKKNLVKNDQNTLSLVTVKQKDALRKEIRNQLRSSDIQKNRITSKQVTNNKANPKRQIFKKSVERVSKIDRSKTPPKKIHKNTRNSYKAFDPSPLRHHETSGLSVEQTDKLIYDPNPFISNTDYTVGSPCFQTPAMKSNKDINLPQPSQYKQPEPDSQKSDKVGFSNHCIEPNNAIATNNSIIVNDSGCIKNPVNSNSTSNANNLTGELLQNQNYKANVLKSSNFMRNRVELLANDIEKQNSQQNIYQQKISQKPPKQNVSTNVEGYGSNSLSGIQAIDKSTSISQTIASKNQILKDMVLSGINPVPVSNPNNSTRNTHKTINESHFTSIANMVKNDFNEGKSNFKSGKKLGVNLAQTEKFISELDSESYIIARSINSAKKFDVRQSKIIKEEGYNLNSTKNTKKVFLVEEVKQIESEIQVLTTKITKQILETRDKMIKKYHR